VVGVTVTPLDAPGNALAPFAFEYVDDRIPRALSFSPTRAYADGGYVVVVSLTDFPDVVSTGEVSVSATTEDATVS
jgi:hypothetical protein